MKTTTGFNAHCEATMPDPEEVAKRVDAQRKAARDVQMANIRKQAAQDKYARAFRAPVQKPKPFKPVAPPKSPESVIKKLEDKALPKFRFESFRSFLARTGSQAASP